MESTGNVWETEWNQGQRFINGVLSIHLYNPHIRSRIQSGQCTALVVWQWYHSQRLLLRESIQMAKAIALTCAACCWGVTLYADMSLIPNVNLSLHTFNRHPFHKPIYVWTQLSSKIMNVGVRAENTEPFSMFVIIWYSSTFEFVFRNSKYEVKVLFAFVLMFKFLQA